MSKKRKQYSREFKIQVIREIESGTPVAQVARQHEVHESLIHKWKKQYSADPQNAFLKKTLNHFETVLQRRRELS